MLPPVLAVQWHPTKNGSVNIADVSTGSTKKVWWQCEKNHEWEAVIYSRVRGAGCPYCSGRKAIKGVNDLETLFPAIAKQWNYRRNDGLDPSDAKPKSDVVVWWQCELGHEWEAKISNRVKGNGCWYCSGFKVLPGFNDLAYCYPEISAEWHPTKNGSLEPFEIVKSSSRKVWWQCKENHEWEAPVDRRTLNKSSCPYCSGKKVTLESSLHHTDPVLSAEWHPTKNGLVTPEKVMPGSPEKVWWLGKCGHEWEATLKDRKRGTACPVCSGKKVLLGFNDFGYITPTLIKQWHPAKNLPLLPEQLSAGSSKKVWWQCEKGHEWLSSPVNRKSGRGCPKCANSVSKAESDIATFLSSFVTVKQNVRTVIPPQELDIYIPEKKIAVEFNGLYWHSEEQGKNKWYHYNKWKACREAGIQLIQIWEDDWNRNPELVKQMLAHKLGISFNPKVYARSTYVKNVDSEVAKTFLEENHIQGFVKGSYYVGLFTKTADILVAVMVVKTYPDNVLSLDRFATSSIVPGGFTKLLKYVQVTYSPSVIQSFSDNSVSDGSLYENNGFEMVSKVPPDYMYIVGGVRKHKFGYRLKKFKNSDDLVYVDELTEKQLAKLNGLLRIWDAGKVKWVKISVNM